MPTERGDLTHPIHAFLRERRITGRNPFNITKMGTEGGKWYVSDDDYPAFLDHLHDYLFVADNKKGFRPLNLVEQRRADGYSPLLVDLDFQYSTEHALHRRRFEKKNIKTFIKAYIDTLKEFYDISDHSPLRFFVCLRSTPYENRKGGAKVIKDGVHIECPDLVLHSEAQQIIRLGMLDKNAVNVAFDGTSFINAEKDIYDETVIKKNGWFYYGESKAEIPPYQLYAVWSYDPTKDSLAEKSITEYTPRMLLERLSIRYNITPTELTIRPEAEDMYARVRAHLSRLSGGGAGGGATATGGAGAEEPVPPSSATDVALAEGMAMIDTRYRDDEVTLARRLAIECLSTARADSFPTWQEVGWCLHSIDPTDAGFETWMDFSKKSVKSAENDISRLYRSWQTNWGRGVGEGATLRLGTLRMWAKEDNPDKYKEIIEDDIVEFIEKEVKATNTSVARILKKMYDGRYVASIEQRETAWFEYSGNTWLTVPQGIDIRNSIDRELSKYVVLAKQRVKRKIRDEEERGTEGITGKILDAKWKELHQLEAKLEASDFKSGVMKEAAGMFYVPKFLLNLDANVYMMGVANGILDLRVPTGEKAVSRDGRTKDLYKVVHRPGRAQDHVRMQAGNVGGIHPAIPYKPYDPENRDPIHDEIDDFFAKVFPRTDLREFMWRLLASHLEGTNKEEIFLVWTGSGGNGKSKLVDLMRYALGEYAADLNATAVTRRRNDASAASPEIMALMHKRFIYIQEPEERESLNASLIKQMTSDLMQGRGLFKDLVSFRIEGKMHLMCNQLPPIKNIDGGITRRLYVIPFESRFVDPDSPEINPAMNIHPRDYELDEKLFRWREAFFSRLVWVYEHIYCRTGLNPIPPIVSQVSDKYKESFDGFAKFKNERIRTGEKALEHTATIADLWRAYQTWHRENQVGSQLTKSDFEDKIDKALSQTAESRGAGSRKTYRATRVFMSDEEVAEFDAGDDTSA